MINPDVIFGRLGNRLFQGAYLYAQMREEKIPDLYVQDYRYFDKYKEEIQKLFGEGVGHLPYVSIHIRRGANPINPQEPKYSENPFYVNLTKDTPDGKFPEYYAKAIAMFPDKNFLVFSDDTEFAKKLFSDIYDRDRFTIVEGQTELEDFNQAASCEHHIIANSSFSFWYAYICPQQGKKVIAPSNDRWYFDKVARTILPPDWIRL